MEKSRSKIYSFRPPCFERSKAGQPIRSWLRRKTHWLTLAVILLIFVLMLSGCASPTKIVCEEQKPLPKELTAETLPDARAYSSDVQTFLREAESWLQGSQENTTR